MASQYKLTYFKARRTAEPIRFLFKYGNVEFEDVRIDRSRDWPKIKKTTPFGQLPLLEHYGQVVNQSVSICRYVAKLVNLTGNDDWENLEIDAAVDTICDLRQVAKGAFVEKDERKRRELQEIAVTETIPCYLARLDEIILKNNGFLALGRLTWADLYFTAIYPSIEWFVGHTFVENYPNLKNLAEKVATLPEIRKWIKERPHRDS